MAFVYECMYLRTMIAIYLPQPNCMPWS